MIPLLLLTGLSHADHIVMLDWDSGVYDFDTFTSPTPLDDALIRELSDKLGVTSIVVSHDLESIFRIADRIVFLYKGVVRKIGTPAEFKSSDDPIVDQFIHGRADGPIE